MTEAAPVFHDVQGEFFPVERSRDALADYCKRRWPRGARRAAVATEWDLGADEARAVCEGSASAATLDRIWKHKRGGWSVLLPIMGAVIGQTAEQFIAQERRKNVETATRLRTLGRHLRPVLPSHSDRPDRMAAHDAGERSGGSGGVSARPRG